MTQTPNPESRTPKDTTIEEGGGGGSRNEYGDEFKDAMDMIKKHSTSEYGRVTDSWGDKHVQLTQKGTWIYYGKSETMEIVEGPTALRQSRIYWKSRVEDD